VADALDLGFKAKNPDLGIGLNLDGADGAILLDKEDWTWTTTTRRLCSTP